MVDTTAREAWITPCLEQLTVDLDAIAAKAKPGNDAPASPATKS